jgi:hypothetical protein
MATFAKNPAQHRGGNVSRRSWLQSLGAGIGGLALHTLPGGLLHASGEVWREPDGRPHWVPKAKRVIWLFMNGGVSHMESFDPKPMLTKYAGKTIAETPFADVQDPKKLALERLVVPDGNGNQRNKIYPLQVGFAHTSPRKSIASRWCVRCTPPTATMERRPSFIPEDTWWRAIIRPSELGSTTVWAV